jgi:hypothetical protein
MRPMQADMLRFAAGDVNFYRWEANGPTGVVDPWGLANQTFDIGGGHGTAFVEWFPDKGVAEMKVMDKQGNELVRYRWDKKTNQIVTVLDHAGKDLPGPSEAFLKRTSNNIIDLQRRMVEKAGGKWTRDMATKTVLNFTSGRAGMVDGRLASVLGGVGTVIVAGGLWPYDRYTEVGESTGLALATRVGLGRRLQILGVAGMLPPGTSFEIQRPDQTILVQLVPDGKGQWYFTATHKEHHSSWWVDDSEIIEDIPFGTVPAFHTPSAPPTPEDILADILKIPGAILPMPTKPPIEVQAPPIPPH